jgi:hypothetical protein
VIRAPDMVVACGGLLFLCYASGCGAAWSAVSGPRRTDRSPIEAQGARGFGVEPYGSDWIAALGPQVEQTAAYCLVNV